MFILEKSYCKKCGRPLDKGDIEYCRGCFEEENGQNVEEYQQKQYLEKENSYTNTVARSFKDWSRNVNILGIIVAIILVVFVFIINDSTYTMTLFISAFLFYCLFKATSLILLAVAEIIQKLQNIEENMK